MTNSIKLPNLSDSQYNYHLFTNSDNKRLSTRDGIQKATS